jgi:hypothetical protein
LRLGLLLPIGSFFPDYHCLLHFSPGPAIRRRGTVLLQQDRRPCLTAATLVPDSPKHRRRGCDLRRCPPSPRVRLPAILIMPTASLEVLCGPCQDSIRTARFSDNGRRRCGTCPAYRR